MGKVRHRSKHKRDRQPTARRSDTPKSHVDDRPKDETPSSQNGERKTNGNQSQRDGSSESLRSRSGIKLVPLLVTENGWNLNTQFIKNVYKKITAENTLSQLFHDRTCQTEDDFLKIFSNRSNLAVFAFKDGEFASLAWLNQMQDDHAQGHYWFAKAVWGQESVTIAKTIVEYWFSFTKEKSSEKLFKVIVGQTPTGNRRAVAFNKRIGFTFLGTIPKIYKKGVDIFFMENTNG